MPFTLRMGCSKCLVVSSSRIRQSTKLRVLPKLGKCGFIAQPSRKACGILSLFLRLAQRLEAALAVVAERLGLGELLQRPQGSRVGIHRELVIFSRQIEVFRIEAFITELAGCDEDARKRPAVHTQS